MVLELPELARENQNWKIYRAHILDSAAAEGVVSHLSGAAPKPVDSRELEAWNSSNAVAKYIILEVITDSLLARLMHHELAHTLFSHLAAIFGDFEPIAIELPAERSDQDEPLREDSHLKSDGADSARTANTVEGKDVEGAGAATRIAHDTDCDEDLCSQPSELKVTKIHDEKPSGTTPAGIPSIPNTNGTTNYPKDPGEPPNAPDGMSRGDNQETAESGRQWQRTTREVNRNDGKASPAPNMADRTSEMTTGDGPIPSSRTRPKNAVKHQHQSTRHLPQPNRCANANAQRSNGHSKPRISLPRRHRLPLEGERVGAAANGYTPSSSGQSTPQKLTATSNESDALVTISIESEDSGSGETFARIRLGGMSPRADDANGPGRRMEMSKGQADESEGRTDESRARADASTMPNEAKTVVVSHRTGAGTYLSTGDAKRTVDETDGIGSHADASSGHRDALNASNGAVMGSMSCRGSAETYLGAADAKRGADATDGIASHADASNGQTDAPCVQTDAITTANATEIVSTHLIELKRPDSPAGDAKHAVDETDGIGSHTGVPSAHTDAIKPANVPQNVRTRPNNSKPPDLPSQGATLASDEPNACGHHSDASSAQTDASSVQMDTLTPANVPESVGTSRNGSTTQNSPVEAARQCSDEPDACGNHANRSSTRTDAQSGGNERKRAVNKARIVKTRQNGSRTPDSPAGSAALRSDVTDGFGSHTDTSSVCTDVHCAVNGTKTAANGTEHVM